MNAIKVLEDALTTAEMISMQYLSDLSDEELMLRPHPQCNHVNWQVGHLVVSEHEMMKKIAPDRMPDLLEGFAEKYAKEHASSDNPAEFARKEELLEAYRVQRDATLAILRDLSEEDLDRQTGVEYAPNVAALIGMQGTHWLMHCGQWVVVRRMAGKAIVI